MKSIFLLLVFFLIVLQQINSQTNFNNIDFAETIKTEGVIDALKLSHNVRTDSEIKINKYSVLANNIGLSSYTNLNSYQSDYVVDSSINMVSGKVIGGKKIRYSEPTQQIKPSTEWFMNAKYGVICHYIYGFNDIAGDWNSIINAFDVNAFANQCAEAGVGYVIFTIGQNSGYYCAPNSVYDKYAGYVAGERCSKRDLPLALSTALSAKGIKLMLYSPANVPADDAKAATGLGATTRPSFDYVYNDTVIARWSQVIREWSVRYGDKIAGWWFDGCWSHTIGFKHDYSKIIAENARIGNPNSIICLNPGVGVMTNFESEDYTAGESSSLTPVPSSRWHNNIQWHVMTYLGASWGGNGTRFNTSTLSKWTKDVTDNKGVITFDIQTPRNGVFESSQLEQLKTLKSIIRDGNAIPIDSNDISGKK